MDKNNLTPEESFNIINKAISNFKMNYKESSKIFLLWGWMLTFACFSDFIIMKFLYNKVANELIFHLGIWILFCLIAFIIQFFIRRKIDTEKKVYSYLEGYVKKLWWVSAVSCFIAVFICIKLELIPVPIMMLIGGIATTTTGLLIKFKPLIVGGLAFFIFSIAITFVSNENIALITGVAMICGYLVPGYLLKSAKEK